MPNNVLSFWIGQGPKKKRVKYVEKMEGGEVFPSGINCPQPILAETIMDHVLSRYTRYTQIKFSQCVETISQTQSTVTVTSCNPDSQGITTYTCDWLVGADRAGSSVRKLLDIKFEGFSWPKEDFCATNLWHPFRKYGFTTANFVLHPVHWGVITVIGNTGLWRCAFGVKPGMTNDEIRAELDDHYRYILPGLGPWPFLSYSRVVLVT